MKYRSKSEEVDAFKLSEDSEVIGPEWFVRQISEDKIDRMLVDGAVRVTGCTIYQDKNRFRARNGDYVIRWKDGTITAEPPKRFKKKFVKEDGEYGS